MKLKDLVANVFLFMFGLVARQARGQAGVVRDFDFVDIEFKNKAREPTIVKDLLIEYKGQQQRFLELYIVNDYTQYIAYGRNISAVMQRTRDITNIINLAYREFGIFVVLVGVEVWTDRSRVPIGGNPDETMTSFLEYRRTHIAPHYRHDNAQLILSADLGGGIVGKAPIRTICTFLNSGGISSDKHKNAGAIATTIIHELAHNFGLLHDKPECPCSKDRCIMSPSGGGSNTILDWSECSRREMGDLMDEGLDHCLRNQPTRAWGGQNCGNGITEEEEECDCGPAEYCDNKCCIAASCKLAANSTCAAGDCCDLATCKPKSMGTVCRATVSPCDLAETCSGHSVRCPSNTYLLDGSPCVSPNQIESYCYKGLCSSQDKQCALLWGRTGRMSHELCYRQFNVMGSANGNCGYNWVNQSFKTCNYEDTLCGSLHCEHSSERLMYWKEHLLLTAPETFVFANEVRRYCKSIIADVGLDTRDPGLVPDGAKCGEKMICISSKCTPISKLAVTPCETDCNHHGVCNHLGQCHCDVGYAPPLCDVRGTGGSVHSGFVNNESNSGKIAAIVICLLLLIPLVVLIIYASLRYKRVLRAIRQRQYKCIRCKLSSIKIPCISQRTDTLKHDAKQNTLNPPAATDNRSLYVQISHPLNNATEAGNTNSLPVSAHHSTQPAPIHKSNTFANRRDKRDQPADLQSPRGAKRLSRVASLALADISVPTLQSSTNNSLVNIPSRLSAVVGEREGQRQRKPSIQLCRLVSSSGAVPEKTINLIPSYDSTCVLQPDVLSRCLGRDGDGAAGKTNWKSGGHSTNSREIPREIPKGIPKEIPRKILREIPRGIPKEIPKEISKEAFKGGKCVDPSPAASNFGYSKPQKKVAGKGGEEVKAIDSFISKAPTLPLKPQAEYCNVNKLNQPISIAKFRERKSSSCDKINQVKDAEDEGKIKPSVLQVSASFGSTKPGLRDKIKQFDAAPPKNKGGAGLGAKKPASVSTKPPLPFNQKTAEKNIDGRDSLKERELKVEHLKKKFSTNSK